MNQFNGLTFDAAVKDSTRGSDRGNQARTARRAELTRTARIRESIVMRLAGVLDRKQKAEESNLFLFPALAA
jgi:hypothetical protein